MEGSKSSLLVKFTNGNLLIIRQHNPPAMPNYLTKRVNVDVITFIESNSAPLPLSG